MSYLPPIKDLTPLQFEKAKEYVDTFKGTVVKRNREKFLQYLRKQVKQ